MNHMNHTKENLMVQELSCRTHTKQEPYEGEHGRIFMTEKWSEHISGTTTNLTRTGEAL